MFYSKDVLTKRGPLAKVWLAAMAGKERIARRYALSVRIVELCTSIECSPVPLSLRLKAHLLVGITRIFYKKCTIFLQESQAEKSLTMTGRFQDPISVTLEASSPAEALVTITPRTTMEFICEPSAIVSIGRLIQIPGEAGDDERFQPSNEEVRAALAANRMNMGPRTNYTAKVHEISLPQRPTNDMDVALELGDDAQLPQQPVKEQVVPFDELFDSPFAPVAHLTPASPSSCPSFATAPTSPSPSGQDLAAADETVHVVAKSCVQTRSRSRKRRRTHVDTLLLLSTEQIRASMNSAHELIRNRNGTSELVLVNCIPFAMELIPQVFVEFLDMSSGACSPEPKANTCPSRESPSPEVQLRRGEPGSQHGADIQRRLTMSSGEATTERVGPVSSASSRGSRGFSLHGPDLPNTIVESPLALSPILEGAEDFNLNLELPDVEPDMEPDIETNLGASWAVNMRR